MAVALLLASTEAIRIVPKEISQIQIKSRSQAVLEANNQLFSELHERIQAVQKEAAKGTADGDHQAALNVDQLQPVVDRV